VSAEEGVTCLALPRITLRRWPSMVRSTRPDAAVATAQRQHDQDAAAKDGLVDPAAWLTTGQHADLDRDQRRGRHGKIANDSDFAGAKGREGRFGFVCTDR
jgi:hypothetical protein